MTHFSPHMDKAKALVLLRKARKVIEAEDHHLICMALGMAESRTSSNGQSLYLKEWVQAMLGPYYTYTQWMRETHPDLFEGLTFEEIGKKAKEGRLAWIDWMIGELQ